MVHQVIRPASDTLAGLFFALCMMERLAHGAPSPTGRARAAPRCGLHSPRGDRLLKTVHCTVFRTLPLMVHQEVRPANGIVCGSFFAIGKCFRPDRWAAGMPKAGRNIGGPAIQAPTSKRQGFRKNISLFCDSIVEANIARLAKSCGAARLFGWSRAPPLQ